uniref:Coiled-coil domain containing 69 n=1 Tax=Lates calcarifer TaxID=8187 RepID=A0A4W6CQE7_LATCA
SQRSGESERLHTDSRAQRRDGLHPQQDKRASAEQDVCLEKQLERFEWQLRILKEVLSANGNPERAELLKDHADEDVCALVLSILDKVKTETTADLNVLHEQRSKTATEEHERRVEELQKKHEQEKNQLTEKFHAAENILKGKVEELTAELQVYNELKRRVEESTFKKDLQRNIQAHGSPGAFWESEQESLLFVIEMKNERVQEQSRKLQQMDDLVGPLTYQQLSMFLSPPTKQILSSVSSLFSFYLLVFFCFIVSTVSPGGEEFVFGGSDHPHPAAERGSQSPDRQLPDSDSAIIEGAAGHEGGAGEAGSHKPESFSGKRAADVQTETQRLVSDHPPADHGAGDRTEMTLIT